MQQWACAGRAAQWWSHWKVVSEVADSPLARVYHLIKMQTLLKATRSCSSRNLRMQKIPLPSLDRLHLNILLNQ